MSFLFNSLSKVSSVLFKSFQASTSLQNATTTLVQTRNLGYINRMMLRDIKRREMTRKFAPLRLRLQALRSNTILPKPLRQVASDELGKLSLNASIHHINDRCALTSKPGGVLSRWRLSRIQLRLLADYNQISGFTRARWGVPTRNAICFTYRKYRPPWFNTQRHFKFPVYTRAGDRKEISYRYPCH